jgi:hypothetical protein
VIVGFQLWCRLSPQGWIKDFQRSGCHDVAETEVDLHGYSRIPEKTLESGTETFVESIFGGTFRTDALDIEYETVIAHLGCEDIFDDPYDNLRIIRSCGQNFDVFGRPGDLMVSCRHHQGSFQYETALYED